MKMTVAEILAEARRHLKHRQRDLEEMQKLLEAEEARVKEAEDEVEYWERVERQIDKPLYNVTYNDSFWNQ